MAEKNMLFITVDDMRAWTGALGGYGGTIYTPNLDALSNAGTLFTNAFAQSPICVPSRTSLLTGLQPSGTGVFDNVQPWDLSVDLETTLPAWLKDQGYTTANAGKTFHNLPQSVANQLFSYYATSSELDEDSRLVRPTLPGEELTDDRTLDAALDLLSQVAGGAEPFFLSVGFRSPHLPYRVPQEFLDLYPTDGIVLPTLPAGDLDDVPDFAEGLYPHASWNNLLATSNLANAIRGYLAEISYVDSLIGQLITALEATGQRDDTVIIITGDHGLHLGEKEHLGKETLWDTSLQVPLIIVDPSLATPVHRVDEVVSLVDLYPTIADLLGLTVDHRLDGESLRGLIEDPAATWDNPAISSLGGNFTLRTDEYRLIRYEDGSTELYDIVNDPNEHTNLADRPEAAAIRALLEAQLDAALDEHHVIQTSAPVVVGSAERDAILIVDGTVSEMRGGAGDDIYWIDNPGDTIIEGALGGKDTVYSTLDVLQLPNFVENGIVNGSAQNLGNELDNILIRGNLLRGFGGNDILDGRSGADRVWGGDGDDRFLAALLDGDDRIWGEAGSDTYEFSFLTEGAVVDLAAGTSRSAETGNDTLTGIENVEAGYGDDILIGNAAGNRLRGYYGNDRLTGGNSRDILDGGAGDDRLIATIADGNDLYQGGQGTDTLDLGLIQFGVSANLAATTASGAQTGTDQLFGLENIIGSIGDDRFVGSALANRFEGGVGDDVMNGLVGNDILLGGTGADRLLGGVGDDVLAGGDADDELFGQQGADKLDGGLGNDSLDGGAANDLLLGEDGDDTLLGQAGDDRMFGAAGNDVADGGSGNDFINGAIGDDTLNGGAENDLILGFGGSDRLAGQQGADTLEGGSGRDVLDGGFGNDVLDGGAGLDRIVGGAGAGADTFKIKAGNGPDLVDDFTLAQDTLAFSGFGVGFDTREEIVAAATQVSGAVRIGLPDPGTATFTIVTLAGLDLAQFTSLAEITAIA